MAKFVAGYLLGLFLGLAAMVSAQHTTTGSGTGATPSSNLLLGTASSSILADGTFTYTPPTSFVFQGRGAQELLRIHVDGTVTYQGRVLGTDKAIWDGLRAVLNPWRVCQELEEDLRWLTP